MPLVPIVLEMEAVGLRLSEGIYASFAAFRLACACSTAIRADCRSVLFASAVEINCYSSGSVKNSVQETEAMDTVSLSATCAMESPLPNKPSGASCCGVYFL